MLADTDPSAILVPARILRRVVKQDRALKWLGRPHPKCYAMPGAALAAMVDGAELGRTHGAGWPPTALLIAQPERGELTAGDRDGLLIEAWRRLFRVRVERAVASAIESGAIDAAGIAARIAAIGRAGFEEARAVLVQDGLLWPPVSEASTYAVFAAVFLELTYFDPSSRAATFPAIESPDSIAALLNKDVNGQALLAATRPPGAPEAPGQAVPARVSSDRRASSVAVKGRSQDRTSDRDSLMDLVKRARAAADQGNHVGSAILWMRSTRRAGPDAGDAERAAARAALNQLAVRLRKALFVQKGESSLWVGALAPLLEHAAAEFWSPERRLLHDLQNVCVDHEREVFRLEPIRWLISMGRRPLKHPLPHLREVNMSKHLRSAARRLRQVRLAHDERARLDGLLRAAVRRAEADLRERFRPRVDATLEAHWVRPANVPERVAYRKLVEELLDPIVARGFTNLGDLRDAASRGNLKLGDVASPAEFLRGDRLLQTDRALARSLDGVHRRGEVYLRWLQRFSALAFGTPVGRFLTLFLALPFGGAFVLLKGLEEIYELSIGRLTGAHLHLVNATSLLLVGTVALGLVNFGRFRRGFLALLGAIGRTFHLVLVDLPARLLDLPLVRRLMASPVVVAAWRFGIKPGLAAAAVWLAARGVGLRPAAAAAVGLTTYLAAFLTFNTRAGRSLQERAIEGIARPWRALIFEVIPGLFHIIMAAFDRLIEWVERLLYAVDEWLRFREGQSTGVLAVKAVLGLFWGVVAYAARIYLVLLIEPQLNPIKHFPVVTVAAKIMLPFVPDLMRLFAAPLRPVLGAVIGDAVAATTVFFLPGLFGFLVWELKSNWRLYEANRPTALGPIPVGSHGETVVRFLRPAFHSGTVPKRFAKLRRALRAGREGAAFKHREALHHVEEAVRRLIEREFAELLRESRSRRGASVEPGSIHLATGRIRIELLGEDRDRPSLWIDLEERSRAAGGGDLAEGLAREPRRRRSGARWPTPWPGSTRSAASSGSRRRAPDRTASPISRRGDPVAGLGRGVAARGGSSRRRVRTAVASGGAAGTGHRSSLALLRRRPRLVVPPEPAERVRQDGAAVAVAVEAVAVDELVIVVGELEGLGHLLVGQRPVAVIVVQVVAAVLEEGADRLLRRLADQGLVVVAALAPGRAAGDVREAADPREHLAELVRPLPGDGPGADPAAADPGDGAALGVVAELHRLLDLREDLLEQEAGVTVGERVVLDAALASALRAGHPARSDEHADGHRHLARRDQVIEDGRHERDVALAVLEDHDAGGMIVLVLGRHVDPPVARGAGEDLALPRLLLGQLAPGHARLLGQLGRIGVGFDRAPPAGPGAVDQVRPPDRRALRQRDHGGEDGRIADPHQRVDHSVAGVDDDRVRIGRLDRPGGVQPLDLRIGPVDQVAAARLVPAEPGADVLREGGSLLCSGLLGQPRLQRPHRELLGGTGRMSEDRGDEQRECRRGESAHDLSFLLVLWGGLIVGPAGMRRGRVVRRLDRILRTNSGGFQQPAGNRETPAFAVG